jgi:hypothetical protein
MLPLFVKPGFLTKQYWDGKRVNYIHPLRLYFFAIIVAVLCTNFFYSNFKGVKSRIIRPEVEHVPDSAELRAAQESPDSLAYLAAIKKIEEAKGEQLAIEKLGVGIDRFMHDLKYISFFLLPLYALVFKLLYVRRKSFYVDHLVYTMHLQSFAMLLMGVLLLIPLLYAPSLDFITTLTYFLIFVYITVSLWYLYRQSWIKTILKSLIATGLIIIMVVMVMGIYMGITLVTSQDGETNLNIKGNVEYPTTQEK